MHKGVLAVLTLIIAHVIQQDGDDVVSACLDRTLWECEKCVCVTLSGDGSDSVDEHIINPYGCCKSCMVERLAHADKSQCLRTHPFLH